MQAGADTSLQADNKVNLLAATNSTVQSSTSSDSSNSAGVGFGTNGWTVNVAASKGEGKSNGSDVTYANTQVNGKTLTITSGGDTNLKGAVATGNKIKAEIGGNLNIETLQDKSTYLETQTSSGLSVSVPIGVGKATGSISASNADISSNYQSANQQSGILAGDGGFQVDVKGNTDLKGGLIASTGQATTDNKNSLRTATLTTSDLKNEATASASTSGISLGTDMLSQGKYGLLKGVTANALDNGSQSGGSSGTTLSAVSVGSVTITDETAQSQLTGKSASQTLASLNRDTRNANTFAQRQDVQAMRQTAEAERAIKNEAVKQMTTLTDEAYKTMFQTAPKFYQVTCPAGVDCTKNPERAESRLMLGTPEEIQQKLRDAPSGAVLAVNGIDNPLDRAGQLAMQNAVPINKTDQNPEGEKPTTIYLMHYEPANNGLSEAMIAAYEQRLAPTLGYTNQDAAYAQGLQNLGTNTGAEVVSQGHSRGTIVQTNANTILAEQGFANSNLSVQGVGGAVTAKEFTGAASSVIKDPKKIEQNVTFAYFKNDPIPVVAGGNSGVMSLSDFWRVLTTSNSVHSCYGTGAAGCQQVQILSPNAPTGAAQNNINLIEYKGGKLLNPADAPINK